MNSPKKITITVSAEWLRAIANQLRRLTPHNHETDEWVADNVHWLENKAEQAEK